VLTEEKNRRNICPTLGPTQLRQLLAMYSPEEYPLLPLLFYFLSFFLVCEWQRPQQFVIFHHKKSTRSKAGQMCWFKAPVPRVRGFKSHRVHSFFFFLFFK